MPRYFIEVCYKGTHYSGFQVQQNANTIQSEIEKSLKIYFKKSIALTGASRTDAGVHALQNYFHFDVDKDLFEPDNYFSCDKKMQHASYSLNSILPHDIVLKKFINVPDTTHCRFDAISREYKYFIYREKNPFYKDTAFFYPYKLDLKQLQEAALIILNTKDFTSFSKRNTQINNFNCSIIKSEWVIENNILIYNVIANRFLRGMVKSLVGTMLKVGSKKISVNDFNNIIKNMNQSKVDFSVPPHGLFLIEVKYKNE